MSIMAIRAVLWDFGGVLTTSPFEAFARYEREHGLPVDFIRTLNATNHHGNAWARLERSEVSFDEFCALYEAEALARGHAIDAHAVLACLSGDIRPQMLAAVRAIKARGLRQGLLTNNFVRDAVPPTRDVVLDLFDAVVESSVTGIRKPEPAFYHTACELLGIDPSEAVFLDDLGVNLKPAREMGMATIKVGEPDTALGELGALLGFSVRS
jgi:putative hydrolase of the HAD superfamily